MRMHARFFGSSLNWFLMTTNLCQLTLALHLSHYWLLFRRNSSKKDVNMSIFPVSFTLTDVFTHYKTYSQNKSTTQKLLVSFWWSTPVIICFTIHPLEHEGNTALKQKSSTMHGSCKWQTLKRFCCEWDVPILRLLCVAWTRVPLLLLIFSISPWQPHLFSASPLLFFILRLSHDIARKFVRVCVLLYTLFVVFVSIFSGGLFLLCVPGVCVRMEVWRCWFSWAAAVVTPVVSVPTVKLPISNRLRLYYSAW